MKRTKPNKKIAKARPSMPSMKLIEFIIATMINIERNCAKMLDNS